MLLLKSITTSSLLSIYEESKYSLCVRSQELNSVYCYLSILPVQYWCKLLQKMLQHVWQMKSLLEFIVKSLFKANFGNNFEKGINHPLQHCWCVAPCARSTLYETKTESELKWSEIAIKKIQNPEFWSKFEIQSFHI